MFTWKGQTLKTYGDIYDAAVRAANEGEAPAFLAAYRIAEPQHADTNLGYLIGYTEPASERRRLYEAFALGHPLLREEG